MLDRAVAQVEQVGIHAVDAAAFNRVMGLPPPLGDTAAGECTQLRLGAASRPPTRQRDRGLDFWHYG